jgi:hypothetical protein
MWCSRRVPAANCLRHGKVHNAEGNVNVHKTAFRFPHPGEDSQLVAQKMFAFYSEHPTLRTHV